MTPNEFIEWAFACTVGLLMVSTALWLTFWMFGQLFDGEGAYDDSSSN